MAEGDIDAVIDTLIFEAARCYESQIIHISGDTYAIVYKGDGLDGWLATVSIDSAGNIGAAILDSYEFAPVTGYFPRMIHVAGTVYAICFTGVDTDGWLITINIAADGTIGAAPIDSFEYDTTYSSPQTIIHIFGTTYAICYTGFPSAGKLCTVTISAGGTITTPVIEVMTALPNPMLESEIVHVTGDIYAIAYKGVDDDGFILTVSISALGDIGASVIDTLEFDTDFCEQPFIVHVSGTTFAIAYKGPDADGWLKTVSIDSLGNIGAAPLDSFEFDSDQGLVPHIIPISGNVFGIAYSGALADGFLKTIAIAADGTIGAAPIDTFEFDDVKASQPWIIHIAGDVYAISYVDTNDDGKLRTIGIETRLAGPPRHLPFMGIG